MADLLEISAEIRASDPEAGAAARSRTPGGSGRLAELAGWLAATGAARPDRPVRLVLAGPPRADVAEQAELAGVSVRPLAADPDTDPLAAGLAAADRAIDEGAGLLLLAVADPTSAPAAVVALLTGAEPVALLPRGAAAVESAAWIAAAGALRDLRRRVLDHRHRPAGLLAELGSPALAAACGFVLRSAARRTPLVLDGTAAVAAALLAHDLRPRAGDWWQVADSAPDPAHRRALTELDARPVLDLEAGSGSGAAALLAWSVLRTAARLSRTEPVDA